MREYLCRELKTCIQIDTLDLALSVAELCCPVGTEFALSPDLGAGPNGTHLDLRLTEIVARKIVFPSIENCRNLSNYGTYRKL